MEIDTKHFYSKQSLSQTLCGSDEANFGAIFRSNRFLVRSVRFLQRQAPHLELKSVAQIYILLLQMASLRLPWAPLAPDSRR